MLGTKKNEEIPGTSWFSREKPTDFPYSLRKLSSSPLPQITSNVLCGAGTEQIGEKKTCRETVSQITEKINRQWPRYDRRRFLAIASRIPSTFFFLLFFFFFTLSHVCACVCACNYARIRNRKRVTILIDKRIASASDERTNIDQRGIISLHKPSDRLPDVGSKLY